VSTEQQHAEQLTETAAPVAAVSEAGPLPIPQRMLALQQKVGNAAFGRMVARWQEANGRTLARDDIPTEAEIKEAEDWAAKGPFSQNDLTPGVGGAGLNNAPGGFDASYDPANDELKITMRCGVEFKDGIGKDGVAAKGLEKQLENIRKLPTEAARQERLALFRWPEAKGAKERVDFKNGVESTIEPFWSGNHQFFLRKKGWSWLGANVKIDIVIKDKEDIPDCHLTIKPVKVPPDVSLGANVEPGQATNARDQVMNVSSNIGAADNFLNHRVTFAVNSAAIVGQQATNLNNVVQTFKGAETSPGVADARSVQTPVVLTGRASATGDPAHNQILSEQRAAAVEDFMRAKGFVNVEKRVTGSGVGDTTATGGENADDRRVDIVIGSGGSQNTLQHEFGHAFGLGDEYANTPLVSSGLGRNTGTPQMGDDATHDNLVKNMVDAGGQPLAGAVCEPTDSIMSVGNVVRPQHYATFHAALTQITKQSPWALGPKTGRSDPLPGAAAPGTGAGEPAGETPAPPAEGDPVLV
jgi:outer membrane protein OmpA-like peptidoglycan-associated protein